jgi:hypothetical protein
MSNQRKNIIRRIDNFFIMLKYLEEKNINLSSVFKLIHSGNNNRAPNKKQIAPVNVPRFVKVKLIATSVLGNTYEATADTPKATDPDKLSAATHHGILAGFKDQNLCPTSDHAR